MEYKMINVEVLEGSLILSPLNTRRECEKMYSDWAVNLQPRYRRGRRFNYDKPIDNPVEKVAETENPFPTEQLKEWAELIIKDDKKLLRDETKRLIDEISLIELGYTEGKIFHRKDCLNYNCGHGIFTGEFGKNCDGITLKFTDGREFLSDFCTLIKDNSPQVMWDITKELQRLQNQYEDNIRKFTEQYQNLK